MKIAILSESPADEAAIAVLAEAILGQSVEAVPRRARPGGWHSVLNNVSAALKELHYRRTAEGLIVMIDSNGSVVHQTDHESDNQSGAGCRFCSLQAAVDRTRKTLRPVPGHDEDVPCAIAIAVPAVEAWFQFPMNADCTETGWVQKQQTGAVAAAEIRKLKHAVYGTDRPGRDTLKAKAVEHAERLAQDVQSLEGYFPNSFGVFAEQIRDWKVSG